MEYARTSSPPVGPSDESVVMRLSAGYANFADTFSGWRGTKADADIIADPAATGVGFGVTYSANSSYGVHWVILIENNRVPPEPDFAVQPAQ